MLYSQTISSSLIKENVENEGRKRRRKKGKRRRD
jgi:hypothetical protein